jgi:Putative peptidoglycan binding domain
MRLLKRRAQRQPWQAKSPVMPDDDDRPVTTQEQGWGDADDWLAGDVDWDDTAETVPQAAGSSRRGSTGAATAVTPGPLSDLHRRRRLIALIAAIGGIILVVVIAMVAFGGSSNPSTPPVTTPAVTTPPNTTPTTTTSTTTTTSSGSTTKVTLPASGSLKQGDTGAEVKTLQQALNAVGTATLTVDGNFGPATTDAVIVFQKANGLTADGVVGPTTAKALNDALAASSP